jgi:hypothetical protein
MASDDVITFTKVETYTLPELEWDDAQLWYDTIQERLTNLNSRGVSRNIKIPAQYAFQEPELLAALQDRIDNKTKQTDNKIMESIIGQYEVVLEDKAGLAKKVEILSQMIDIFNNDERLTSEDPAGVEAVIDESLQSFGKEDAVILTVAYIANEDPDKITVGKAMGYIGANYPHLRPEMKLMAPMVAKQVGLVNQKVKAGDLDSVKEEAIAIYPQVFDEVEEVDTTLKEPIFYQFEGGDLKPDTVKYQVNDEVKTIELTRLIRKMKHDKAAFAWLNQHKPHGGPQYPAGGSGTFTLVISNDPFLNFTKSAGRYWEQNSCERYNSYNAEYSRGPLSDILYGNCVVFAFKGGLPEGWPQQQPENSPSGNIDSDPDGTLLGRQNIKWGYKENQEGNLGMGLDPAFYPRAGRQRWSGLLNKALAMIVDSLGYLDYDQLRTPYNYRGHCDVGSGVGNLVYRQGTTCYTRIEGAQINPDLIMASNETIGFVAFDRLTRPIVDTNIKLILAQNPNIWAIAGNEVGIARLIKTRNIDILRFLVASPDADEVALNAMIPVLAEVDENWNSDNGNSTATLFAHHPNATSKTFDILLENYRTDDPLNDFKVLSGVDAADGFNINTPYVCFADEKHIAKMMKRYDKLNDAQKVSFIQSLLFAPNLSKTQYIDLCNLISESFKESFPNVRNQVTFINFLDFCYALPLNVSNSWAFNDFDEFSLSRYTPYVVKENRQRTVFLNALNSIRDTVYVEPVYLLQNTRNKRCYNWFWSKITDVPAGFYSSFYNYPIGTESQDQPFDRIFTGDKQWISALDNLSTWGSEAVAFEFKDTPRTEYPDIFVNGVLQSVEMIQTLGWGEVAMWLRKPQSFQQYIEVLYKQIFGERYLGRGKIAPPPEDEFDIFEVNENIGLLVEAAVGDYRFKYKGLAYNTFLPTPLQNMIFKMWPQLSEDYLGEYDMYMGYVERALSQNPNTAPTLLDELKQNPDYIPQVVENPNTYTKTLLTLYSQYPAKVLANKGLGDAAFSRLWNNTWRIATTNLPSRNVYSPQDLLNKFNTSLSEIIGPEMTGVHLRKKFLSGNYLGSRYFQSNVKFWRGGNIKKGKFSQFQNLNLYKDPVADYPIIPQGNVVVIKFNENNQEATSMKGNEIWVLSKVEKVSDGEIHIEGDLYKWSMESSNIIQEDISTTVDTNEFFNFIPEENRVAETTTTDDDGSEIVIKAPKWTVDNIIVFQDDTGVKKKKKLPEWRMQFNQQKADSIIKSYILRGMDVDKLIAEMETPKIMENYSFQVSTIFKVIDDEDLWTKDFVNEHLNYIVKNISNYHNVPLTKNMLEVSIAPTAEEMAKYGVYSFSPAQQHSLQRFILSKEGIPISYIYYILMNVVESGVVKLAKRVRRNRSGEFITYYRIRNPPPKRKD